LITSLLLAGIAAVQAAPVTLREADEVIPTYKSGAPDPNPMFYFGRASQGAEGRIYPYPLSDNLTNLRSEQTYHLVYLENEYVRIGIAPELGGRLFSALDKSNNYDYIYRQHVIKPALIGLTGAWISGGIEWNIPHHHRASTFSPVQFRTEEHTDGSKTVWVGELELRHRMRWAIGYTLRPGSSVLECSVRIVNRTPFLNSMLCFANVAVNTNDKYQIIFPPTTQWVTHHAKREFTTWPIATQPYGEVNWDNVDVSWYTNHQKANSMFAWNYEEDFFAGYDHGKQAGVMSVADHHIVPGKKFWTWGNGPRGRMWDEILTDTDGPYIELMVGAYSDNQPDYSWLQPFETRAFEMNWYPFRDIGGVKNANLDAAVNLEVNDGQAQFGFYTTKAFPAATVQLKVGSKVLLEEVIAIDPAKPYTKQLAVPAGTDPHEVRAALSVGGRELVAYSPIRLKPMPQPAIVALPPAPKDINNSEELNLAALRVDQFHNPTLDADPYWTEAIRRDPADVEANTGLGRLALRRAQFDVAEKHFRAALARLMFKHTTPKNAEPLYYLGVALKAQGQTEAAFDAFYKATWSQEWKSPAYFALAEIATARGDFPAALDFVNRSLDANALNIRAAGLKAATLRHLNRKADALAVLDQATKVDFLDVRLLAERSLATGGTDKDHLFELTVIANPATLLELAAEYANASLWADGVQLLSHAVTFATTRKETATQKTEISPLVYYYLADFAEKLGSTAQAADFRRAALAASPNYVFPFQAELIPVLRCAIAANPADARAPYYLGNLLFDWQPDEAIKLWEKSVALDPTFPIAWRNLAQAFAHQPGDAALAKAISALEKAVALGEAYPTHFAELDRLYQAAGTPVAQRLAFLEQHQPTVVQKDEGLAALIGLKTFAGKADEAIALLQGRTFSLWEGDTAFDTGEAWVDAQVVRGLQQLGAKQNREALACFEAALQPPANLRAEQRGGSRRAEIIYWIGCAQEALGQGDQARKSWTDAVAVSAPTRERGGRSAPNPLTASVQRYYQLRAQQKLGRADDAATGFRELVTSATAALTATAPGAAPGSGLNRQSQQMNLALAHYVAGLGHAGLGAKDQAREEFTAALAAMPDHLGAKLALGRL
jgi:tetratricopeptide (TPR) repeat protein